jgi:teichuronic acid biosynthesis glycosyltransferase TuaC
VKNKRVKVLHITNNYPTVNFPIFGIFVKEQIESLVFEDVKCDVFFINGKEKGKIEYIKSIFKLRKTLNQNSFDIVHCHHVFSAIVFLFTGKYNKVKSVVSFQNDPDNESSFNLFNLIKNKVSLWIFKNNSVHSSHEKGVYLPNGVNTDFFKPIDQEIAKVKLNLDLDKKYVLFVSSNYVRKQKRYDIFNEVIIELKKIDSSVEELKMINIERDLIPYYFNSANVHLLTSDFEGSPNSVKESMSCNTPVVSRDVGNVKELFEGSTDCFISSKEIADLTKLCLIALKLKNINTRDNIINKKIDINNVAKSLRQLYINLIQQ